MSRPTKWVIYEEQMIPIMVTKERKEAKPGQPAGQPAERPADEGDAEGDAEG